MPEVELVAQAVFADQAFVHHLAQQPFGGAFQQVAVLQQQAVGLTVLPVCRLSEGHQHLLEGRQLCIAWLPKQRDQQHTLQPIDRQVLQSRIAASATVEQPAGFRWGGVQGGQQVLVQRGDGCGVHGFGSA